MGSGATGTGGLLASLQCAPQLADELPSVRHGLLGNRQAIRPVRQNLTQFLHVSIHVPPYPDLPGME
jgi:hypothetical protein